MDTVENTSIETRENEKGAALVMALLMTFLLLTISAGLILETTTNSMNVTDAASEQQAYNAAESGIQSVVDALRFPCTAAVSPCRVRPNPLYYPSLPDYNKNNKITFSKVVNLTTSNSSVDNGTRARLSRVLSYENLGASPGDPVKLGQPNDPYVRRTGYAYNLSIIDPDNTGSLISYYTVGELFDHDAGNNQQITFGTSPNIVQVTYVPKVVSNLSVPAGTVQPTDFGSFIVTNTGTGSPVTRLIRFQIAVNMTVPYPASRLILGYIEPESTAPYTPKVIFDSQTYSLGGSDVVLDFTDTLAGYTPWTGIPTAWMKLPPNPQPIGYEARLTASPTGFTNSIQGTIGPPEPIRLRIQSTGYGPRGSTKMLEAIILRNYFNGLGAPATLTLVGPPSTTNPATSFTFNPGNSNAMTYSGADAAAGASDIIPPVGTTSPPNCSVNPCADPNLDAVIAGFGGKITNTVIGTPSNVSAEVPPWLASPASLDQLVRTFYQTALNSYDATNPTGRVFTNTNPTSWGDNATGTGITFCDGNCTLGPIAGGGLLIVTGQLTLNGNFNWHGLIIVTGQAGVVRTGGGTGTIQGNIVVAPYVNSAVGSTTGPASGAGFLAPQWTSDGSGNSNIVFNSDNQNNGLAAISNIVLGVIEK